MNVYDIFVLVVMGLTVFFGFWKGMVCQVFSIVGLIIGYYIATTFYVQISSHLPFEKDIAELLSFLILFIGCIILVALLSSLIGRLLKLVNLSWVNRLGGALLGFLKGGFVVCITALVLVALLPIDSPVLRTSKTLPTALQAVNWVENAIPQGLKTKYQLKIKALKGINFADEVSNNGKNVISSILEKQTHR